jgi:hypothetical protein
MFSFIKRIRAKGFPFARFTKVKRSRIPGYANEMRKLCKGWLALLPAGCESVPLVSEIQPFRNQ